MQQSATSVNNDPLLNTREVAEMLRVHPLSIYRFLREKREDLEFPVPIRLFADRLAWRRSAIDEYEYIASRPLRVVARGVRKPGVAKSKKLGGAKSKSREVA
jgi:predicted DNA-binding transcriptional regulator AlpA